MRRGFCWAGRAGLRNGPNRGVGWECWRPLGLGKGLGRGRGRPLSWGNGLGRGRCLGLGRGRCLGLVLERVRRLGLGLTRGRRLGLGLTRGRRLGLGHRLSSGNGLGRRPRLGREQGCRRLRIGRGRACGPGGRRRGRACRPGGRGRGRACRPGDRGRGLRAGGGWRWRRLLRLGGSVPAYRRILVLPEIGSRPGDRRMPATQRGRPQLRDPREGLPRLMLVAQFLGHRADVVRDLQHQRIGVPKPPQPRRVRILEHPPSRNRIVILQQHLRELLRSAQNIRIIVRKVDLPQLNGTLQQADGPRQITRFGKDQSPLTGRSKRGRLRHARHAARYAGLTPGAPTSMSQIVHRPPCLQPPRKAVYSSSLCSPPGRRYPVGIPGSASVGCPCRSGWRNGRRASLRC